MIPNNRTKPWDRTKDYYRCHWHKRALSYILPGFTDWSPIGRVSAFKAFVTNELEMIGSHVAPSRSFSDSYSATRYWLERRCHWLWPLPRMVFSITQLMLLTHLVTASIHIELHVLSIAIWLLLLTVTALQQVHIPVTPPGTVNDWRYTDQGNDPTVSLSEYYFPDKYWRVVASITHCVSLTSTLH